jgi:hypothetical protein
MGPIGDLGGEGLATVPTACSVWRQSHPATLHYEITNYTVLSAGHNAISRRVASCIPDRGIGCSNLNNPSSRTMVLGFTQPLMEMSTRNLPSGGGLGRPARKADNLTAICEPTDYKNVGASTSHNHAGLHGRSQGCIYTGSFVERGNC